MKHYNPRLHTTEDVVRLAIIPFSRAQQAACATVLMKGVYTRPQRMVTHNWGNLFRDLVAAVVADALDESDYGMIGYLLDNSLGTLIEWVAAADKLQSTYWICAFSVNQHASICGKNPASTKDSVTKELHPIWNVF